jgi:hypothetical protein
MQIYKTINSIIFIDFAKLALFDLSANFLLKFLLREKIIKKIICI